MKNANGLAHLDSVVYIADTGNNRVTFFIQNPAVLFRPINMRVDDLRQHFEERGISSRNLNKKEIVKRLSDWISIEQRWYTIDPTKLNTLPLNVPIILLL